MPENIRDHGGIEGNSSQSACEQNVMAIDSASKSDSDSEVYLPEGEWFIGSTGTFNGDALRPGCGTEIGDNGLSFVGDGPNKSHLRWGALSNGENNRIRYCDGDHGTVTWKNMTYDGRWRQFRDQGYDLSDSSQWGIRTGDVSEEFRFENVMIKGFGGNAVFTGFGHDSKFVFDGCSFYDNGFGIHQAMNGERHQHHIAAWCDSNASVEVRNCKFRLCSGTVINTNGPANGDGVITVENVYAEGFGSSFHKFDDPGKVIDRNIRIKGVTNELRNNYVGDIASAYFYRFSGDASFRPIIVTENILIEDCPGYCYRVANNNDMLVRGGSVMMGNVANHPGRNEALSGHDGSLIFDNFGDMSVQGTDGYIARLDESDGSIDNLYWGDAGEGFGNSGGVNINAINGASQFSVTVPSKDSIGVNSSSQNGGGQQDGGGLTEFIMDNSVTIGVALGLASRYLGGSN